MEKTVKEIKTCILIDTDLIIDLLRGYEKAQPFFKRIENNEFDAHISVVTVMEIMSGKSTTSTEEQKKIQNVIDLFKIVNVDLSIAKAAGFINRDYGVPFPDALIASSAIMLKNCAVATRNKKHYEQIKGIIISVPY